MKNPVVKKYEEEVPQFQYDILETIKLSRKIPPIATPFDEVSKVRKSARFFKSVTVEELGTVLWYSAKVKSTFLKKNGYILTHRGTPSAGARHPIDIIILNPNFLIENNFYYYNPFEHSLNQLNSPFSGMTTLFTGHINKIVEINNATIIWFVAHVNRTAAKYENAQSLIWRDAGALINNIQMTCTAIGINSCPIGSLGEPYISNFFNPQPGVCGAGGLLIG